MKIKYYKTKKGLYISSGYSMTDSYKFNGVTPKSTHATYWYFLEGVEDPYPFTQKTLNEGGKYLSLKSGVPSVLLQDFQQEIPLEKGDYYWDDDNEVYTLKDTHEMYETRGLYDILTYPVTSAWGEKELQVEYLGDFDDSLVDNFATVKYEVDQDLSFRRQRGKDTIDISDVVSYSELSQIMVPELLIHNQPCTLSSEVMYKIVRNYIKDNIDPMQAVVTSDYNFCFTVKKKIHIKPYELKTEIKKTNGRSYAKKRFNIKQIKYKEVECFEMTNKKDNYKGYTPIKSISANNLDELISFVKDFLDEIMKYINTPVKECECCSGIGHFVEPFEKSKIKG